MFAHKKKDLVCSWCRNLRKPPPHGHNKKECPLYKNHSRSNTNTYFNEYSEAYSEIPLEKYIQRDQKLKAKDSQVQEKEEAASDGWEQVPKRGNRRRGKR